MSFRLTPDESIPDNVRRMAHDRLDDAVEALEAATRGHDLHASVHLARKRAKHVRALTRLVRGSAPQVHDQVNAQVRDAARLIAEVRDRQAMIETLDDLDDGDLPVSGAPAVRDVLVARRDAAARDAGPGIEAALEAMVAVRADVDAWPLPDGGVDAVSGGFAKTYRRCRARLDDVRDDPSTDGLHEWRKRVKYHRSHVRMLEPLWPAMLAVREGELHTLTDLLGDDHDLAVLRGALEDDPRVSGETARGVTAALDRRRAELQRAALPLGARLFALPDEAMVTQLRAWWHTWQDDRGRPPLPQPLDLAPTAP